MQSVLICCSFGVSNLLKCDWLLRKWTCSRLALSPLIWDHLRTLIEIYIASLTQGLSSHWIKSDPVFSPFSPDGSCIQACLPDSGVEGEWKQYLQLIMLSLQVLTHTSMKEQIYQQVGELRNTIENRTWYSQASPQFQLTVIVSSKHPDLKISNFNIHYWCWSQAAKSVLRH